jgi:hypothetical protein
MAQRISDLLERASAREQPTCERVAQQVHARVGEPTALIRVTDSSAYHAWTNWLFSRCYMARRRNDCVWMAAPTAGSRRWRRQSAQAEVVC